MQVMVETAAHFYRASKFDGPVSLTLATEIPPGYPPSAGFLPWWRALLPQVRVHSIEGQHYDLIQEPRVRELAALINGEIDRLEPLSAKWDLADSLP